MDCKTHNRTASSTKMRHERLVLLLDMHPEDCLNWTTMAGWVSLKLKVVGTFLQQIDQQTTESLGKNGMPQLDELDEKIFAKSERE